MTTSIDIAGNTALVQLSYAIILGSHGEVRYPERNRLYNKALHELGYFIAQRVRDLGGHAYVELSPPSIEEKGNAGKLKMMAYVSTAEWE